MTATQPTLFATDQTRFEAWKEFRAENPAIWRLFRQFAWQAMRRGSTVGARMIGERIRWMTTVETTDAEYKINDHHWPYYARLLVGTEPRFRDFFTLKNERFDSTIDEIVEFHEGLKA